jgi:hypothetical protein
MDLIRLDLQAPASMWPDAYQGLTEFVATMRCAQETCSPR